MAALERTYNVPLRKEFLKVPRYKRANKAMIALRQFLSRHMKAETIIIGGHLNRKIWERGIKSPPHHVKVTAVKDDKGVVTAELFGAPKPAVKEEKKAVPKKDTSKEAAELKEVLEGEMNKGEVVPKAKTEGGAEPAKPKEAKTEKKAAKKAASQKKRDAAEAKEV
ncbi:60S ribosomal protein L31 [Candidatus Woesearchaeota archaeon]|nr:60S ribosomal protein L31 [Candidatus Woesearchaeota archaeon]